MEFQPVMESSTAPFSTLLVSELIRWDWLAVEVEAYAVSPPLQAYTCIFFLVLQLGLRG